MNITVDGRRYSNFVRVEVFTRMDALSRTFTFEATSATVDDIPFAAGQPCVIDIDGEVILTGWIEALKLKNSKDRIEYSISGRDLLGDLMDSNLPNMDDVGRTVVQASRRVISYLGIDVEVIDDAGSGSAPLDREAAPEPSQTAYEYLAELAKQRQVLLSGDGEANLHITRSTGTNIEGQINNRADGVGNNLLSSAMEISHVDRFFRYVSASQESVAGLGLRAVGATADVISNPISEVFDHDPETGLIRKSRVKAIVAESDYPPSYSVERIKWERNIRRARGRRYTVTVPGYRDQTGALWRTNTNPVVTDDFMGIIGKRRLIEQIRYTLDDTGFTTQLTMTNPDAYRVDLQEPVEPTESKSILDLKPAGG